MKKKLISLLNCKPGDVLANDVVNDLGAAFILKNTTITQYIKEKLSEIGINEIWVYQRQEKSQTSPDSVLEDLKVQYSENVSLIKEVLTDLSAGKGFNKVEMSKIVSSISTTAKNTRSIIGCLNDMRYFDDYTYRHSVNVAFYSMLIAVWMGMAEDEVKQVIQAGLLHDVGKMRVPNEVLNKKGPLTREEFEVIKKHPLYGYYMLEKITDMGQDVKESVLMHHERIDGSGYPSGRSGDSLSRSAKIVSVADVFDAITSDRIYKKRATPFEAFEIFKTTGLGSLDSDIINLFINNIAPYYTGLKVLLNSQNVGEIVYIPPHDVTSPVVMTNGDYLDLSRTKEIKIESIL